MFKITPLTKKKKLQSKFLSLLISAGFTIKDGNLSVEDSSLLSSASLLIPSAIIAFAALSKPKRVEVSISSNQTILSSLSPRDTSKVNKSSLPEDVSSFEEENKRWIRVNFNTYRDKFLANSSEFHSAFDKFGVPRELENLVVAESRLNPNAISPVGAVGLWQFMPETGKGFGLSVDNDFADFKDFSKSSNAAARYLRHLFNMLHSWDLAVMAYNCGPGSYKQNGRGVRGAMFKAGVPLKQSYSQDDIWKIWRFLPLETKRYYLEFLHLSDVNDLSRSLNANSIQHSDFQYINMNHINESNSVYNQQNNYKFSNVQK